MKGRYVLRPGPSAVRPARARRTQAAILVGTRFASAQGLICASRVPTGARSPAHPERVPFARLQPLARLPARARWATLSRPPQGAPRALRAPNSARRRRARKERTQKFGMRCRPAVADLHRSHQRLGFGEVSRVKRFAPQQSCALDTRRHRCFSTQKPAAKAKNTSRFSRSRGSAFVTVRFAHGHPCGLAYAYTRERECVSRKICRRRRRKRLRPQPASL